MVDLVVFTPLQIQPSRWYPQIQIMTFNNPDLMIEKFSTL
jgi:hypothetical protein